ncbi:helix-turn-helix domain-containing protein [archaeon]|jgi:excisionase family DNA binding protein|nr:helix-turn-helix domain-containing protein [archaeon]MBT7931735.1 helix-turn-helix domain-containing protein [Candidatus Woesearchaeota archaeon]
MSSSNLDRWLSVQEISQHLGVSKESIYRWLSSKRMPAHKVGRQWKFKIGEVDSWVRQNGASEEVRHGEIRGHQ